MTYSTAAARCSASSTSAHDDVGIVLDLGHCLHGGECPPTCCSLVREHGRLFTIEVNDNWREWDNDLAVGSVHLIETLESSSPLRKMAGTSRSCSTSSRSARTPSRRQASIDTIRAIDRALDRLDVEALRQARSARMRSPPSGSSWSSARRDRRPRRGCAMSLLLEEGFPGPCRGGGPGLSRDHGVYRRRLGRHKIEAIALDEAGRATRPLRADTPRADYGGCCRLIADLVRASRGGGSDGDESGSGCPARSIPGPGSPRARRRRG